MGVGHERDETLADYVADLRVSTPTAAAHAVVPDKKELLQEFEFKAREIQRLVDEKMRSEKLKFENYLERLCSIIRNRVQKIEDIYERYLAGFKRLNIRIDNKKNEIENYYDCLNKLLNNKIAKYNEFLAISKKRILSLNPYSILRRGYSITYRASNGQPVKSEEEVGEGEVISTKLSRGKIQSKII